MNPEQEARIAKSLILRAPELACWGMPTHRDWTTLVAYHMVKSVAGDVVEIAHCCQVQARSELS